LTVLNVLSALWNAIIDRVIRGETLRPMKIAAASAFTLFFIFHGLKPAPAIIETTTVLEER
jgi:hypothetical protein